jgi:hypothetical protein
MREENRLAPFIARRSCDHSVREQSLAAFAGR